jgi:hypothetical protein
MCCRLYYKLHHIDCHFARKFIPVSWLVAHNLKQESVDADYTVLHVQWSPIILIENKTTTFSFNKAKNKFAMYKSALTYRYPL